MSTKVLHPVQFPVPPRSLDKAIATQRSSRWSSAIRQWEADRGSLTSKPR